MKKWALACVVSGAAVALGLASASGARANDAEVVGDALAPIPAQGCPMSRTCRYDGDEHGGYVAGSCEYGGWNCIGDPCHCDVYLNNYGNFGQVQGTFQP